MLEQEKENTQSRKLNLCGPQLRRIRLARGLTLSAMQKALAQDYQLYRDRTNLGRIEGQKRRVSDVELLIFANILGVSVEQLLGEIPSDPIQVKAFLQHMQAASDSAE
jgi:transcriptional regulator with XRE-family HTH domain